MPNNERRLTLAVLIDALGWEYIQDRDFLNDALPYRCPLQTILGFSSGAIPTILTGLPPVEHGHWNLFYYDPAGSPFRWLRHFNSLPPALLDNRYGRKVLKELGRRVLGLGKGFECAVRPELLPYFNWVEKRNIYDLGGITGGHSIFDQLQAAKVPFRVYSYHRHPDEEILSRCVEDIRSRDAAFFFLYLSEMDMFLHMHCQNAAAIDEKLSWYAEKLRRVFEAAHRIDPEAAISIFSDHGMAPVTHHFDLMREVEALGLEMPKDYLSVYDSTMARFWFFSDRARTRIPEVLSRTQCGRILSDAEMQELGVFFPDRRFGELIFLLDAGWILSRSDFNGAQWMPLGMHGYDPADRYSDAVYLSNKPFNRSMQSIADIHGEMYAAVEQRAFGNMSRPKVLPSA
jgi:predicted AlkP superfamily pyrophosphatase or phosphodiesterase